MYFVASVIGEHILTYRTAVDNHLRGLPLRSGDSSHRAIPFNSLTEDSQAAEAITMAVKITNVSICGFIATNARRADMYLLFPHDIRYKWGG